MISIVFVNDLCFGRELILASYLFQCEVQADFIYLSERRCTVSDCSHLSILQLSVIPIQYKDSHRSVCHVCTSDVTEAVRLGSQGHWCPTPKIRGHGREQGILWPQYQIFCPSCSLLELSNSRTSGRGARADNADNWPTFSIYRDRSVQNIFVCNRGEHSVMGTSTFL